MVNALLLPVTRSNTEKVDGTWSSFSESHMSGEFPGVIPMLSAESNDDVLEPAI